MADRPRIRGDNGGVLGPVRGLINAGRGGIGAAVYREPSLSMHRVFKVVIQRCCDSSLGHLVLTVQAFGVDAQEHFDAMASPLSDLSGWDSPIEPGGEARVPIMRNSS